MLRVCFPWYLTKDYASYSRIGKKTIPTQHTTSPLKIKCSEKKEKKKKKRTFVTCVKESTTYWFPNIENTQFMHSNCISPSLLFFTSLSILTSQIKKKKWIRKLQIILFRVKIKTSVYWRMSKSFTYVRPNSGVFINDLSLHIYSS